MKLPPAAPVESRAAIDQVQQQQDNGYYNKDVDSFAANIEGKPAKQPADHQDNNDNIN